MTPLARAASGAGRRRSVAEAVVDLVRADLREGAFAVRGDPVECFRWWDRGVDLDELDRAVDQLVAAGEARLEVTDGRIVVVGVHLDNDGAG